MATRSRIPTNTVTTVTASIPNTSTNVVDLSVFERAFFIDLRNRYGHLRHTVLLDDELDQVCSICMEPYRSEDVQIQLPCQHIFHQTCAEKWLRRNETCPLDRQPIFDF